MNRILRRVALAAGSLCLLLVLVAAGGYIASERRMTHQYDIAPESIPIPTDSLSIAHGLHLARAIAKCAGCHGNDLAGRAIVDDGPMGRVVSTNLTSGKGGVGGTMRDEDWVRAIRHGVAPDGRPLIIMPAMEFNRLSVGDLGDIIAYVKSRPAVDHEQPPTSLGPVARALIAINAAPMFDAAGIDHSLAPPPLAPADTPSLALGDYITHTAGCDDCHGPTFAGGKIEKGPPAWPPAANLTPTGLKAYDEAAFFTALRTGVRPGGTKLNDVMPWAWTREMTDNEIKAVWMYLNALPPRELGAR
jgi:cytochrome c553